MIAELKALFLQLPSVTQGFIAVISVLTLWFAVFKFNIKTLLYGPTVLTMLGIFGCFLGIALGLMEFDTRNVQGSVPALVDGIKTAFWASVFGVGGALIIKIRHLIFGAPALKANDTEGATIDDLMGALRQLHAALGGKEDSSLLTQAKLMRQETGDRLHALKSSLDSYMERMADNNSKALIEALKEVIRDFNAKINEQFGENFKQLNAAVEKIVIWQERYRQQMEEMITQQKATAESMTVATERYTALLQKAEDFAAVSKSLDTLLVALNQQRDELRASLEALGSLLTKAGSSLPEIEQKIVEMTRQIEAGVKNNSDQMAATIKATGQSLEASHAEMTRQIEAGVRLSNDNMVATINSVAATLQSSHAEMTKQIETGVRTSNEKMAATISEVAKSLETSHADMNRQIEASIRGNSDQVTATIKGITQAVQGSHTEMKKLLTEMAEGANRELNSHVRQLTEQTKEQVVALDKALGEELTKSITTLGEHLTALSRRFVDDYAPLTDKLRTIVQMSRNVSVQ